MWPIPCTFSVFTTLWKSQFRGHEAASNRRPSRVPPRSHFSFVSTELARGLTRCSSCSEVTSDTRNGSYCEKFRVTKVTFTPHGAASTIQLVVWQFWGRAAEASLTEKSRALFYCVLTPDNLHANAAILSAAVFHAQGKPALSEAILRASPEPKLHRPTPRNGTLSRGPECYNSACPMPN
jgi:hypothetical protein